MHNSVSIEENVRHCLDMQFFQPGFILQGRICSVLFQALLLHFGIKLNTPAFITSHSSWQHITIFVNKLMKLQQNSAVSVQLLRSVAQTSNKFSISVSLCPKIFLASSLLTPRHSASSLVFTRMSCIMVAWVFSIFSLVRVETGWPRWGSSSSDSLPSRKRTNFCAWFGQSSLYTFLRSCYTFTEFCSI